MSKIFGWPSQSMLGVHAGSHSGSAATPAFQWDRGRLSSSLGYRARLHLTSAYPTTEQSLTSIYYFRLYLLKLYLNFFFSSMCLHWIPLPHQQLSLPFLRKTVSGKTGKFLWKRTRKWGKTTRGSNGTEKLPTHFLTNIGSSCGRHGTWDLI